MVAYGPGDDLSVEAIPVFVGYQDLHLAHLFLACANNDASSNLHTSASPAHSPYELSLGTFSRRRPDLAACPPLSYTGLARSPPSLRRSPHPPIHNHGD